MLNQIIKNFEEISKIPHETFCEEELAKYIFNRYNNSKFFCYKDKYNNVYIRKEVNASKPFTLFQSHLDMVCVKEANFNFDFKKQSIQIIKKGKYLTANKTSLGADNGVGVAIIMCLLDNANFNIEALFTTDEEVSTSGAINFDYSLIKSNNLISLDGFRANEIILGCAGICDMNVLFNPNFSYENTRGYKLIVSGLKGGHSGADISKNIGNSIKIATEILGAFKNIQLETFNGGNQFNFIPNYAEVNFTAIKDEKKYAEILDNLNKNYPNLNVECSKSNITKLLTKEQTSDILSFLNLINFGVIKKDNSGILLSQNLSAINIQDGFVKISERFATEELAKDNIEIIKKLSNEHNLNFEIFDKKPGYLTDKNCDLVKKLSSLSFKVNKIALKKQFKHISLEGCIFQSKLPNTQIVIVSPKIEFPHSTKEKVLVPTIKKTYDLLIEYLKQV